MGKPRKTAAPDPKLSHGVPPGAPSTSRRVEKKDFDEWLPVGFAVRDTHFKDCTFAVRTALDGFSTVERCTFERCKVKSGHVSRVLLRDVTIDRLPSGLEATNVLFDRVTLRGTIGKLVVEQELASLGSDDLEAALDFHDRVEWAIDLRDAKVKELRLRGVRGDKVLRDPARQGIARLDRMRDDPTWRRWDRGLVSRIDGWLAEPLDLMVVALDESSERLDEHRAQYELLRAEGFLE